MITSDELAFVRLAMRRRLLSAHVVQEAVERKRWDRPDRSLPHILVDMGALEAGAAAELRRALSEDQRPGGKHATVEAKDPLAREPGQPAATRPAGGKGSSPAAREDEEELPPKVPRQIAGYRLVKLLGAGAMGAVYLAEHVEIRREVALKLLLSEGAPSPRAIARFRREARLAAKLDHPNIVRVFEAGVSPEGQHYIAMEMVRGRSVAELLALNEVTPRRAVHIMRKVAEAVGYAHTQGVIHRDLKPANVLVEEQSGEARVTDFGLATMSEPDEDDKLTRTGAAVGTPAYMAPEQVKGQLDRIDARTDVYALGATLYELLTGSPPFEASTFLDLAKRICEHDPVAPRKRNPLVPASVETICLKALEKEPGERYQTAQEMAKDLAAFLEDAPIVARPPSIATQARRYVRRRPWPVLAVVGGLGAVIGYLGWQLTRPGQLVVEVSPPGARLMLDEREVGEVPPGGLALEVPAGRHELRFRLEGYLDRALGAQEVEVGRGETVRVSGRLVSTKGLLRLTTSPSGAEVQVLAADGSPVTSGTTDFLCRLEAGRYQVRVVRAPPGYLGASQRQEAEVAPGGDQTSLSLGLVPDRAALRVESDPPEDATVREPGGGALVAPARLPGAGRREVIVSKAGYLARRVVETVPPGETVERRVTLEPLVSFRRPMEGRILAGPLVRDLDGDGFPDLIVLEEGLDGRRLVLLPGGGEAQPRFREPTAARALVEAEDVNADGVLDVILGHERGLEVRDGRTGRRLAGLDGVDAGAVTVCRVEGQPPQLMLLQEGLRPLRLPVSLDPGERKVEPARDPRAPPLVQRGPSMEVALFPLQGGVLVQPISRSDAAFDVPNLEGVGVRSRLFAVWAGGVSYPWALALPRAGPAWVFDPHPAGAGEGKPLAFTGRSYRVGDADAQWVDACAVRGPGGEGWLFLTDEKKGCQLFRLLAERAVPTPLDPPPGRHPLLLPARAGTTEAAPRVWTRAGEVLELGPRGWERLGDLCTATEGLLAPDAEPGVADLDRDGASDVVGPSPDRRSLVALSPWPDRVRWRVRAPAPRGAVPAVLGEAAGQSDLLLLLEDRLLGLGRDGQARLQAALPGEGRHVAAGPPFAAGRRSAVYVACEVAATPRLQRWGWKGGQWQPAWDLERRVEGLVAAPLDRDGDGEAELLVGGPLALLRSTDGEPLWSGEAGAPPCAPAWLGGEEPLCLGLGGAPAEPTLVARGPDGKIRWETPLGPTPGRAPVGPDEAEDAEAPASAEPGRFAPRVLVRDGVDAVAVLFPERVVVTDRRGKVRWRREGTFLQGALVGQLAPRVVLVSASGLVERQLLGLEASGGADAWRQRLPGGPGEVSAPVAWAVGSPQREAVALVAPSGVALVVALDDGTVLTERRGLDTPWRPWAATTPGGAAGGDPPALVLARADGRLLALEPRAGAPALDQAERRRARLRELVRQTSLGEPFVKRALDELAILRQQAPTDPSVALALAGAQLALGSWAEARQVAQDARERVPAELRLRLPEALRIRALTSFGLSRPFDEVVGDLVALAREDAGLAVETALELSRRARRTRDAERELGFLRQAVVLAPHDPQARRSLGLELLRWRGYGRLAWDDSASRAAFVEARQQLAEARQQLLLGLAGGEDAEARAGALLAVALEEQVTRLFLDKLKGTRNPLGQAEEERLRELVGLADALAAGGEAGVSEERAVRTLTLAREVHAALRERGFTRGRNLKAACGRLKLFQPRWKLLLDALAASVQE